MHFCGCFQVAIFRLVEKLKYLLLVILVVEINTVFIEPFLNDDVGNLGIVPPSIFYPVFRQLIVILEHLVCVQHVTNILIPVNDGRIRLRYVIESRSNPCQGIIVENSFQEIPGEVSPSRPARLRGRAVRYLTGGALVAAHNGVLSQNHSLYRVTR